MRSRPALQIIVTFSFLILAGALVLYLLEAGGAERGGRLITAFFTAASAVCVTGLTVVDLSREMDFGGQLAVLVLIQVGGLGVLTLSNWILLSLRGRFGRGGGAPLTNETLGGLPRLSPAGFLNKVLLFTVVTESCGAAVLFLRFLADHEPGRALWLAVFTSVSAFCNAGFSLFSTSLTAYRHDLVVNGAVILLVVAGGIGFVAAVDIYEKVSSLFFGRRKKLSFHTRVVLIMTGILIASGFLLFLLFEQSNTFLPESLGGKLLESLFLSVTARTAGFNTVATGQLTNMTLVILMILMAIGASPGSTGGGVKTTSVAIVWAMIRSHLQNRPRPEVFGRSVPYNLVSKALALIIIYVLLTILAMVALQATEFGHLPYSEARGMFLGHLFEVISALSTVGLSTGITERLSAAGLSVIMVCMFVGRLGPLVVVASLIGERPRLPYLCPEADVMVG